MVKSIVCNDFGGPESLTFGDLPSREMGEDQVRIAIHAAGVGFADLLVTQGLYQFKPEVPFAPGLEAAGEVMETGPAVTYVKPGDRVVVGDFYGAFAEEMVAAENRVTLLPDKVDYIQGAAFRVCHGTSYYALKHRANLQAGEVLAVHGAAGGVGLAAVELGKLMGATVIGCVGSDDKFDIVREYGADHVVNYSTDARLRDQIKELTGGKGADVIYDAVGGDVFDESLRCINWDGRLLVVGFAAGRIPSAPANLILLKSCAILGVFYGAWVDREPGKSRELHETLLSWCAEGKIRPHVSSIRPLREAPQALQDIAQRKVRGKVVLQVR